MNNIDLSKTKYTKDLPNKKIIVEREFAAPLNRVWDAWTQAHLLDQWWAPRPWRTETKTLNFAPGGMWLYNMIGPDGTGMFCRVDYTDIDTHKYYEGTDMFCDEEGNRNYDFPSMGWKVAFSVTSTGTKVVVDITFGTEAELMKIVEMGFEAGFAMGHNNLDELLAG